MVSFQQHRIGITRGWRAAALVLVTGALSGCAEMVGLNLEAKAAVSFAAAGSPGLFSTSPPDAPTRVGGHTIVVSSVDLRVSEIELKGEDGLKSEIKGGSTVVALPVNGSVVTPISAQVVAGTFDEFEMKVEIVRVRGTFDGSPFDVTVSANDELELELDPALVITENGTANVTVSLSIASWFRNSDGSAIDPRSLTVSLLARLRTNIIASFDAFGDHDRDGSPR